jgi:spermidine synthase
MSKAPKEPKELKPKSSAVPAAVDPASPRFLPVLAMLFVGSGCAALIYEVVWFQLLQLTVGSSAVSMGVLLATYMGGMCVGSLALPRFFDARQHPLRVYAILEAGIGIFGILVLVLMPLVDSVYTSAVGHGMPAILLRALVSGLCLLPPTFLMGASLPAASRWIKASPEGVGMLGMQTYGGRLLRTPNSCDTTLPIDGKTNAGDGR